MPAAKSRRELGQNIAQHLSLGGMPIEEVALMMGIDAAAAQRFLDEANARQPKRCAGYCLQRPMCPYCNNAVELQERALSARA